MSCISPKNVKLPARLERLSLRLQPYTFIFKLTFGLANAADFLSRHPVNDGINDRTATITDDHVNFIIDMAIPRAMTLKEIQDVTASVDTLQQVTKLI